MDVDHTLARQLDQVDRVRGRRRLAVSTEAEFSTCSTAGVSTREDSGTSLLARRPRTGSAALLVTFLVRTSPATPLLTWPALLPTLASAGTVGTAQRTFLNKRHVRRIKSTIIIKVV